MCQNTFHFVKVFVKGFNKCFQGFSKGFTVFLEGERRWVYEGFTKVFFSKVFFCFLQMIFTSGFL